MRQRKDRLLAPRHIPSTLWCPKSERLILPRMLCAGYKKLIENHGLYEVARTRDSKSPPVGGISPEETDRHFAQAFDGSAARAQLAWLDPKDEIKTTSNDFLTVLSGNDVCLTDAPAGVGAASLTALTVIAELRRSGIVPRHPMNVSLIGAEISPTARVYMREYLEEVQEFLEEQAIYVAFTIMAWNVTDQLSTTDLIKEITRQTKNNSKRLLVIANFNQFLEQRNKKTEASPQIEELLRYASGANSFAIWIEPNMNRATAAGGLLPWIRQRIKQQWKKFARETTPGDEPIATSSARFRPILSDDSLATVRLAVMSIELAREL